MIENKKYKFGMIGLGTMGCNLLLNIADHGFSGAGYDKSADKVSTLNQFGQNKSIKGFTDINNFVQNLQSPRVLMMLVPAGKIVDDVIAELLPLLDKGDIIIDGGNSHFTDTERRSATLEDKGFHFFGMGISGGEEGARYGPSMMPGGDKQTYKHVQHIFEAIAANKGRLQSFLLEITTEIFSFKNTGDNHLLLDEIKDEAKSKGTGKWTSQVAMDLNLSIPVIDIAVSMRDLSKYKLLRTAAAAIYADAAGEPLTDKPDEYLISLEQAFYFCMATTYAQGMHLLYKASLTYNYKLQLDQIAKIWRGGCIIRSAFLEDIYTAFHANAKLEHLLLDESVQSTLKYSLPGIRKVVSDAAKHGLAIPAYAVSLSYFDVFRCEKMPSNLIQAQRDFFGAHTYELIDKEGVFHSQWDQKTE